MVIKFKAKGSEIVADPLCLGNISEDFSESNMKKAELHIAIHDFNIDHNVIAVDGTLDIYKYLMKKHGIYKCLCLLKKVFAVVMTFLNFNPSNVNSLECVSMANQECKTRTKIINVNNNEVVFYPFSINVNKCSESCNNINDPYAKLCVPDVVKNTNVKVFNLASLSNQTKHIEWHETCKCKCRLGQSVCSNIQRWNEDKYRCECREELSDKQRCDRGFIWNPSDCNCKFDKSCDIGEYLDYKNCKCRRKIVGELVKKCSKSIDQK